MAMTSESSVASLLPETIPTTAPGATSRPPPRPLHLLIPPPPSTTPPIPQTAPLPSASTFSPTSDAPRRKAARRQSSISYLPPDSQPLWSPRRTGSLQEGPSSSKRTSLPAPAKNANALTLAEKHADLLHFIAQKESKCLDLRAQLAAHEAELLQLKKKWERIVARDFGRAQAPPASMPAPASSATAASAAGGNQMLDSLGRLFAAAAPAPSAAVRPSPFTSATRHRITASSASSSHATTSTAASSGDRLSQSSVSSVGSADERVRRRRSGSPSALLGDLEMELGQAEQGLQRKAKRASMPPQSAGVGVGTGAGVGVSAWMGAGRRKLEELREGETFTRSQKRASVLLSDVSQSIFSVLSPGTPTTPALTASASSASASLLDDDEPDERLGGVLVPDALVPTPKSPMKAAKAGAAAAQTQEDDDDEWNW